MASKTKQSHIFFFPYMGHGHMIPTLDMAVLFASKGIKTTIISTPQNLSFFSKTIETSRVLGFEISVLLLKFPSVEVGLPDGCEAAHMVQTMEDFQKLLKATTMLDQQLENLLQEHQPDCLVADYAFPWATDVAAKFGIPRLVFHGTNYISLCITQHLIKMKLSLLSISDSETLVVPDLPDEIMFVGGQIPEFYKHETPLRKLAELASESERKSYGVVVNSFYELEPAYADHYRNFLGVKAWHIGPTFLCNKAKYASLKEHESLEWLNSKRPDSVIYVNFGSILKFDDAQLLEIALGLEASAQEFIWVVKKEKNEEENEEGWLPQGFEKRVEGRGLVVRGWAPQVPILEHQAIGGFVTHCGWNSVIEAVSAGVPMATWPSFAEQFYNEKLVTQVLGIGVGVGVKKWARHGGEKVGKNVVEKVVTEIMVGEKAEAMRSRAKALGEMAKKAVEEGGSSHKDFNALIQELGLHTTPSPPN